MKQKSHIKIHEDATGGIYTVGVTTRTVSSEAEVKECVSILQILQTLSTDQFSLLNIDFILEKNILF